jgi:hypothetical protein
MSITSQLASSLISHVFRQTSYTSPASIWLALDDGAAELSGDGYARVNISAAFGAPVNGVAVNTAAAISTAATAEWTVRGIRIYTASTGGSLLAQATIVQKTVPVGHALRIAAGDLVIAFGAVPDGSYQGGSFRGPCLDPEGPLFRFPGLTGQHVFDIHYDASDLAGATFQTGTTIL